MYYVMTFLIGLMLGFFINNFIKFPFLKKRKQECIELQQEFPAGSKLYCINILLEKIRNKEQLPIKISPILKRSLDTIAKSKDWDKKLDEETLNNLYSLYVRCKRHIDAKPTNTTVEIGASGGFEPPEVWEGTEKEYEEALAAGQIKENMIINIIYDENNYHGSYLTLKEDGSIEEYMN